MPPTFTITTLGRDGMLHVPVPGAAPGTQYEVTVRIKGSTNGDPAANNGLEDLIGALDDDDFRRPDQGKLQSAVPFE